MKQKEPLTRIILIVITLHLTQIIYMKWGIPGLFTHSSFGGAFYVWIFAFSFLVEFLDSEKLHLYPLPIRGTITFPRKPLLLWLLILVFLRFVYSIMRASTLFPILIVGVSTIIGGIMVFYNSIYAGLILGYLFRKYRDHANFYSLSTIYDSPDNNVNMI